jgi:aspartyl-tRNA(Asn)/glutamyl-tRNA(Gln) amidotransferase subunit A
MTSAPHSELETISLSTARERVVSGATSARTLAEQHYERIAALDDAQHGGLNSFLALTRDRALQQAERIDTAAKAGNPVGPLAGVPLAIKDVLVMRGAPSTAGSKILQGYHPPYDATAVARLEAAGAVLLGKLNCDEFAMGSSNENSAYGPVQNPKAPGRVPGGSSGGSAASVAAGLCVGSLGTDTGGSIRQPAAFCDVVGILPTYGRVSRFGLIAFASSLDRVGPLARSVSDAATLLEVLAGEDPLDATSSAQPVAQYTIALARPVAGLRIGVPEEYLGEGLDSEIRAAVERSLDALRHAGCIIESVSLPHTKYAVPTYYVIATAEASANLSRFDGVRFGHRAVPKPGEPDTLAAMFRNSRDEGFGPEVKRRILLGTYALSAGYYDAYYRKAQQVRTLLAWDFLRAYERVDAIVCPVTPNPAFKLGEKTDDPVQMYLEDIYSVAASLAGICGMSVPAGFTSAGLPIGVQVLGRHFDEATMLRVGAAIEAARQ